MARNWRSYGARLIAIMATTKVLPVQVAGAISKEKKASIVGNLTELLNKSTMVYGMEYKGISVRPHPKQRRLIEPPDER